MVDEVSAKTAVTQIAKQETSAEDMDNRYGPFRGRYHIRDRKSQAMATGITCPRTNL